MVGNIAGDLCSGGNFRSAVLLGKPAHKGLVAVDRSRDCTDCVAVIAHLYICTLIVNRAAMQIKGNIGLFLPIGMERCAQRNIRGFGGGIGFVCDNLFTLTVCFRIPAHKGVAVPHRLAEVSVRYVLALFKRIMPRADIGTAVGIKVDSYIGSIPHRVQIYRSSVLNCELIDGLIRGKFHTIAVFLRIPAC